MQPPRFWFRPPSRPGLWPILLAPLAAIWAAKTRARLRNGARKKVGVPVIAVGNINLGGTGKTPTVIALAQILIDLGYKPHIVTRGYGGSIEGPYRVDPKKDLAKATGDEALLLAGFAPVWVAKDRALGAQAAVADGADCILLDDALQNPALAHDFTVTVVDAEVGFGNGRVCPAGPLREPVSEGLSRNDLVLAIGLKTDAQKLVGDWPALAEVQMLNAHLEPLPTGFDWQGLRAIAFAGIGRPDKFFKSLRAAGADIIGSNKFGDHAEIPLAVMKRMQAEAWAKDAHLVTTEKDAVRLPPEMRAEVMTFPVRLQINEKEKLISRLKALF